MSDSVEFRQRKLKKVEDWMLTKPNIKRLWSHVKKKKGNDGCWEWQAKFHRNNRRVMVFTEPGKPGKQIHMEVRRIVLALTAATFDSEYDFVYDTCGNPKCVNPDHLTFRAKVGTDHQLVCKNGHPMTPENTLHRMLLPNGRRPAMSCAQCGREYSRMYWHTFAKHGRRKSDS